MVAVSGGVDSSVTALSLLEQGFHVMAVTFRLVDAPGTKPAGEGQAPSLTSIQQAARVCAHLGIRHEVTDLSARFQKIVVEPFVAEYEAGRTPNPCVRCNPLVKWGGLLELAASLGCTFVATGHYARVRQGPDRWELLRGADAAKDQSYALYGLNQDALSRTLFPIGALSKQEVRRLAARAGLCTASVRESQDICFIPRGDHRSFLARHLTLEPGPILDTRGRVLGMHRGLPLYTIGQRRGLGIVGGERLYVIRKDLERNCLVLGPRSALCRQAFDVTEVNWVSVEAPGPGTTLKAEVELRYRTRALPAEIHVLSPDTVRILLPRHEMAVTPGQSAVWYQGDLLIGGGTIEA